MLKEIFIDLIKRYSTDISLPEKFWKEIQTHYSGADRHYHDLLHLENMLIQLSEIKHFIQDWDSLLFSLFYHDIVYSTTRNDNEEKSAEFAADKLSELNISSQITAQTNKQILATKSHENKIDEDTAYFLDADLSILGQPNQIYKTYSQNIRKEFAQYPDEIYNPGRKKVIQNFLNKDAIYKTYHFKDKFETQAKINLQKELSQL